jgi:hypothetical protein
VDGAEAGAKATRDLGRSWDIVTDMAVKLVPGGHPYHALAEAAANARARRQHRSRGVESITVSRRHDGAAGPAAPRRSDRHGAQPAYFLAAGAADREFPGACRPARSPTRSSTG